MLYPLGQQNFSEIRKEGRTYVDKTMFIPLLLRHKFCFLSRPRRFGKSLLLSTLEYFFLGKRELFKGLAADSLDWGWEEYPVIRIDLNGANYHEIKGLECRFEALFHDLEDKFALPHSSEYTLSERFRYILRNSAKKMGRRAVVLIDEYEKPLLDVIDDQKKLNEWRNILSGIYSVLKSEEDSIELALLTGVTRFGHLNIFSGLNNLTDISLDPVFTAICGITEEEIETRLKTGVEYLADKNGVTYPKALEILKDRYDGYHFSHHLTDIYNPYSLLTALSNGELVNTWMQSGNSFYLLEKLKEMEFNLFELEGIGADRDTLMSTDPGYEDPVSLLYQSGYLTIKGYDSTTMTYTLGIPNQEVRTTLYKSIIPFYLGKKARVSQPDVLRLSQYITEGKAEEMMKWLQQFFSRIPYQMKLLHKKDSTLQEADFQFMIYAIMGLAAGLSNLHLEKSTSFGRLDMVMETLKYVYIFEFKLGKDAMEAMNQINSRDYPLSWVADKREIIKIGVAFSTETRGITDYLIETV